MEALGTPASGTVATDKAREGALLKALKQNLKPHSTQNHGLYPQMKGAWAIMFSVLQLQRNKQFKLFPEGPSTQYLRSLVPKTIPLMVFGTRVLKYWVLGPSGFHNTQIMKLVFGPSEVHEGIQPLLGPVGSSWVTKLRIRRLLQCS